MEDADSCIMCLRDTYARSEMGAEQHVYPLGNEGGDPGGSLHVGLEALLLAHRVHGIVVDSLQPPKHARLGT